LDAQIACGSLSYIESIVISPVSHEISKILSMTLDENIIDLLAYEDISSLDLDKDEGAIQPITKQKIIKRLSKT
jgi:hypothetical protein